MANNDKTRTIVPPNSRYLHLFYLVYTPTWADSANIARINNQNNNQNRTATNQTTTDQITTKPTTTPCSGNASACLRAIYSKPLAEWIAPKIDPSVKDWQEFAPVVPNTDTDPKTQTQIALGKKLFFEPFLSVNQ